MIKVGRTNPFYCNLIYCQPGSNSSFLTEFTDCLSSILKLSRFIFAVEFNIHIDNLSENIASSFMNITESFNLIQHVSGPTHNKGHTLDLVFTYGLSIDSLFSEGLFLKSWIITVFYFICPLILTHYPANVLLVLASLITSPLQSLLLISILTLTLI